MAILMLALTFSFPAPLSIWRQEPRAKSRQSWRPWPARMSCASDASELCPRWTHRSSAREAQRPLRLCVLFTASSSTAGSSGGGPSRGTVGRSVGRYTRASTPDRLHLPTYPFIILRVDASIQKCIWLVRGTQRCASCVSPAPMATGLACARCSGTQAFGARVRWSESARDRSVDRLSPPTPHTHAGRQTCSHEPPLHPAAWGV